MDAGTLIITVADNFSHKAQRVIRDFTDTPANRVAARKALWAEIDAEAMGLVGGCFVHDETFMTAAKAGQAYPAAREGVIQSW